MKKAIIKTAILAFVIVLILGCALVFRRAAEVKKTATKTVTFKVRVR